MSSTDLRYPAASGGGGFNGKNEGGLGGLDNNTSPPTITPSYQSSSLPTAPSDADNTRETRCATGIAFVTTIHGILNIVTIVALVCILISAGVADQENGVLADLLSDQSNVRVSAMHTRNAVLAFAVIALIFILVDTILHVTRLIHRLPAIFDTVFIVIMLALALIFLILGCCAAAWEQKMRDTVERAPGPGYRRKGAAASAAFFLFVSMITLIINFGLRLVQKPASSSNP